MSDDGKNEINLREIVDFVKTSWKSVAITTAIGGLLAASATFFMQSKFQASAAVDIAMVTIIGGNQPLNQNAMQAPKSQGSQISGALNLISRPVETAAVLTEKMKIPTYYSDETIKACGLEAQPDPKLTLSKSLKPLIPRDGSFVSIVFTASSPAIAKACLDSVLVDIKTKHAMMAKPYIEMSQGSLSTFETRLMDIERTLKDYPTNQLRVDFTDPKFSASALLLNSLLALEQEANSLRNKISEVRIGLSAPQTTSTTFVSPVYSPSDPVSPKRSLIILIGLIAGGLLGLMLALSRRILKRLNSAQ